MLDVGAGPVREERRDVGAPSRCRCASARKASRVFGPPVMLAHSTSMSRSSIRPEASSATWVAGSPTRSAVPSAGACRAGRRTAPSLGPASSPPQPGISAIRRWRPPAGRLGSVGGGVLVVTWWFSFSGRQVPISPSCGTRAVQPLDAHLLAPGRAARRARGEARDRRLGVHEARAGRARARDPGGADPRRAERRRRRVHARRRARRGRLRARGRDARAAQEPAAAREAARLDGVELRVVGAQGWGGVDAGGDGVRWLGEVDDEELARLYRGARCLVYPRCTRASASRCSRRSPAARRSSRARARRWRRSPTAPRASSTRSTPRSIAAGIERGRLRGATS